VELSEALKIDRAPSASVEFLAKIFNYVPRHAFLVVLLRCELECFYLERVVMYSRVLRSLASTYDNVMLVEIEISFKGQKIFAIRPCIPKGSFTTSCSTESIQWRRLG
jgi:hypothetical protein